MFSVCVRVAVYVGASTSVSGCIRVRHCTISSVWVVVCGRHGNGIPLITTATWRNRLPFTGVLTENHTQVDKPQAQL